MIEVWAPDAERVTVSFVAVTVTPPKPDCAADEYT